MGSNEKLQRYGLLGWPVKHSLSPPMQEAAFRAKGINASYELLPTPPEEFESRIAYLVREKYCGWNITVPHKPLMIRYADEVEPIARHARSINTVVNRGGKLFAYSTDGYGLAMAIQEAFQLEIQGHRFLFWGCGGATTACAHYFACYGAAALYLINRTRSKAEELASQLHTLYPRLQLQVFSPNDIEEICKYLSQLHVIIQATSVGLRPDDPSPIPEFIVREGRPIYDMSYQLNQLAKLAQTYSIPYQNGLSMLLYQGARSFELWTETSAPIEIMSEALQRAFLHHQTPSSGESEPPLGKEEQGNPNH